jgi:hypothetical protein
MAGNKSRETPKARARSGYRPWEKIMTAAIAFGCGVVAYFATGLGTIEILGRLAIAAACTILAVAVMHYCRIYAAANELLAEERKRLDAFEADPRSRAIDRLRRTGVVFDMDAADMLREMRSVLSKQMFIEPGKWIIEMAKAVDRIYGTDAHRSVSPNKVAAPMIEAGVVDTEYPRLANPQEGVPPSIKVSVFGSSVCDWIEDADPNVNGKARKAPISVPKQSNEDRHAQANP